MSGDELIVVRSLAASDMGIFERHRPSTASSQRAIQINAPIARAMLDEATFASGSVYLETTVCFGESEIRSRRKMNKANTNWRLGGSKLSAPEFSAIEPKDFVLIRAPRANNGSRPILVTFVARNADDIRHAGLAAIVERKLQHSMTFYEAGTPEFEKISDLFPRNRTAEGIIAGKAHGTPLPKAAPMRHPVPPMPRTEFSPGGRPRTVRDRMRSPHIVEQMLRVAGDLSAPAQSQFMETVRELAEQLRRVLTATGRLIKIERNHRELWGKVAGLPIGFVDGGLANLSMLGSAPVAARVGGYVVTPGDRTQQRESFAVLKQLIDELYASGGGIYTDSFPDVGALRDAARISVEAAGALHLLERTPGLSYLMLHGALVNPVSRYSDVMEDGRIIHRFPDFSSAALSDLLPRGASIGEPADRNFIGVHQKQLDALSRADAVVCGVVERESSSISLCKALLASIPDGEIANLLPQPPTMWKRWFLSVVDPATDDRFEGQRITDTLLFRCVLEPGEALVPIPLDRNELRRAPAAWAEVIGRYPKPWISYLSVSEWSPPVRIETFERHVGSFAATAELIMHCSLLLPRYAFPVGLDIVDKFAKVPDWMSRPVNTRTAVMALRGALDSGNTRLFEDLRRVLCGSSREWLLRPGVLR